MTAESAWHRVGDSAAEIYARMLASSMFAPWAPRLLDLVGVRAGERVLDVACGTGVVASVAAGRVGDTGRVAGVDLNPAMLAEACAVDPSAAIEWIEANALEMPMMDGEFDVVVCQHGLQQMNDRIGALREMRRVLTQEGRIGICVWDRIEANPGMNALAVALERHVGELAAANRRAPFSLGDPSEVERLLHEAGFTSIEVRTEPGTARFPSADAFVVAQLSATPLATLGPIGDDRRTRVANEVRAAIQQYEGPDGLALPMSAHLALARRA